MPLLNYTTTIAADKSISEIQKILVKAGASKIMTDWDATGNIISISFQLLMNDQPLAFTLPTNWKPVQQVLIEQRRKTGNSKIKASDDQARRVAWRITKDWVEAQMAIIETRMVTPAQVFLPYAVTNGGQLMYEYVANNPSLLLGDGR